MNTRMRRFVHGKIVRCNERSPYRCAPPGAHGKVVEVGREVVYVDFPQASRLPMDPFELESVASR